jgi:hypothetical protein
LAVKGYGSAAGIGGVSRKTVYNWAKNDPAFKAAMSAWTARMEMHATADLTAAVAAAARTFGRAAATDWRVAAILLRDRGLLAKKSQANPNSLQLQLEALPKARRQKIEARLADMIAGKEPEYLPELRALQERMIAEEAAAVATPAVNPEKEPEKARPEPPRGEAVAEEDELHGHWVDLHPG